MPRYVVSLFKGELSPVIVRAVSENMARRIALDQAFPDMGFMHMPKKELDDWLSSSDSFAVQAVINLDKATLLPPHSYRKQTWASWQQSQLADAGVDIEEPSSEETGQEKERLLDVARGIAGGRKAKGV